MQIIQALALLVQLAQSAQEAAKAAQIVGEMIQNAHAEGRHVSLDELKGLETNDDNARKLLDDAIAEAELEEQSGAADPGT